MRIKDIPHKNLFASAAIALMIFVIGFFSINPPSGNILNNEKSLLSVKEVGSVDIDSDGDGLPDWKEKLYGSDMYNADTDGDGMSDGEEILTGHDPVIAGPNDTLKYLQDPNFATSSTDVQGIKKEFFAKYLAESGQEIRETTFKDLMKTVRPERFQVQNDLIGLNITSDNSKDSIKKYLNAFGLLIDKYSVRAHRTEDEILESAMKSKSSLELKELQLSIVTYQNFAKDLKNTEVPSVLATAHLGIINGYEGMAKGLMAMQIVFTDPVNGTAGLEAYSKHKLDVTDGYAAIVTYVGKNNIEIGKDEPGAPFYWRIPAETGA